MPPMRLLSKDFIGSMLSTQKQTKLQDEFCEDISETMEISDDDENSPQVGRKAIESESSAMWHTTKKRDFVNIENKMKNLRVEMLNQFEL